MGPRLLLNCSVLPHPHTQIHSCLQEHSDTHPKETQQPALHVLLLPAVPSLVHSAGCPDQPQLPGHNPGKGSCTPASCMTIAPLGLSEPQGGGSAWQVAPTVFRHPYPCRADTMEELCICECCGHETATEHAAPAET